MYVRVPVSWCLRHCQKPSVLDAICAPPLVNSCRKQTRQLEETGVLEQRRQLEAHAAERARADAAGARQRAIERREEERQQDIAMQRELTLQRHMKQV